MVTLHVHVHEDQHFPVNIWVQIQLSLLEFTVSRSNNSSDVSVDVISLSRTAFGGVDFEEVEEDTEIGKYLKKKQNKKRQKNLLKFNKGERNG